MHKSGPEFLKCWRSNFEANTKCDEVDGCVDDQVVVDKFVCHDFSKSYTCNNQQLAAALQVECITKRVGYSGAPLLNEHLLDVELVGNVHII